MRSTPILFAAAVLAAGAAQAQRGPGEGRGPSPEMRAAFQAAREACADDAKSLCAGLERRELMMCLRGNAAKLSAPCKDAMSKLPQRPGRPGA
jgi:hypothetical protein